MIARYTGPFSRVHVPSLGRDVDRGDPIEMPDGVVLGADWEEVSAERGDMTVAEMRAALDDLGIDVPKGAKRAELSALLTDSTPED